MFTIKQYLQYKNTPDGKPRVLVEGVDYWQKNETALTENYDYVVAELEDCRPLLSAEVDGNPGIVKVTEGDVYNYSSLYSGGESIFYYSNVNIYPASCIDNIVGSFFDDPAKYSKLLWNCSEEEGWKKAFKLLGI